MIRGTSRAVPRSVRESVSFQCPEPLAIETVEVASAK